MPYINASIFEKYEKFLNCLQAGSCAVIRQYCIEDVFQRTYDINELRTELARKSIQYVQNVERYPNGAMNNHHWQTQWVWRNFIPALFNDLGIQFNPLEFRAVKKLYKKFDFSYHVYSERPNYLYVNLETGEQRDITNQNQILDISYKNPYHQRFVGFHKVCMITNKIANTRRRLMINCDSMSIPVIPLLMPFFKEILVLDNRTRLAFKNIIDSFNPTHYIALGLVRNFIQYNKNDIDKIDKKLYFIINNKIFQHNIQ